MIGIGITSRNRNEILKRCVDSIFENTESDFKLVIVDDHSDNPVTEERALVIRHDERKGIAKSKNDCLRSLDGCDYFFLFDDDCWPIQKGWETEYIRTSKISGCSIMCYTWDDDTFGTHSIFLESFETIVYEKNIWMHIGGNTYKISEDDLLNPIRFRLNMGYGYGFQHKIDQEIITAIDLHRNGCGCMIFIDKRCIDTIGGFWEEFPMYGGEHIDYFIRGYNAGLSPGKFADIHNSEKYFFALDRTRDHVSTNFVDNNPVMEDVIMKTRELSSEKVPL
jgi:glycosyltransferase involved in cell wall biosynthesis